MVILLLWGCFGPVVVVFRSLFCKMYKSIQQYVSLSFSYGYNFLFTHFNQRIITFQRRIVGLHQNTTTGSIDITDTWEPLEGSLLPWEPKFYAPFAILYTNIFAIRISFGMLYLFMQPRNHSPCFRNHSYFV